jgi:hypothetical protein
LDDPIFITILGLVDVEGDPKGPWSLDISKDRFQAAAKDRSSRRTKSQDVGDKR